MFHLTQALHRGAREYPNRIATVFGARRRTYAEFVARVARAAAALRQLGLAPGDRVGILSQNSDRYLELYFATWWAGGVVNPVNIRWSPREIAYSLEDCDTRILAIDSSFAPLAGELSGRAPCLRHLVYTGEGEPPAGMHGYEALIAANEPAADAMRRDDDLCGVFYTGGTTGFPKGVMLTHKGLLSGALIALGEGVVMEGDVALHSPPMFHLADGIYALMCFQRGCTQIIIPGFQPEAVLQVIQQEGISNMVLVPTMIQMLVDHPRRAEYRLDSVARILYGASPISEAVLDRAMQAFPGSRFAQGYGMTETSAIATVLGHRYHTPEGRRLGKMRSAGHSLPGCEVRIVDDQRQEVPRGVPGEIAMRGPGTMTGYWNREELTRDTVQDGWVYSGDGAYMDEDGFIYIVDRVKDMIVSGGENVYSAEVENALASHAAVAACAVIGIPDARWGEAVHAIIVCKPGVAAPTADEIKAHCRELIATYKCPRSVEYRTELPLSGAGKVQKNVLREPYWKDQKRRVG